MSLKVFSAFPGRAQPKISTWFSKPNQSLIKKVTKKKVRIKHEHFFMFARLKTL